MKKHSVRLIGLLTLAVMLFSACSLKEPEPPRSEIDRAASVISIGEESVSYAMFCALFDSYLPYMQYAGSDPYESEESMQSFIEWITDILTDDLVALHQAKAAGFDLDEAQLEAFETETEEEIASLQEKLMQLAQEEYAKDPSVPVEVYFEGIVNSESEYYTGVAMSWEDYKQHYREQSKNSAIVKAYKEKVCGEFEPDEDDILEWYESALIADRANYTVDPDRYRTDQERYERYFGLRDGVVPVTYVPSGYSRIMCIVVYPEGELSEEYKAKLDRMQKIKEEYCELAFEDAVNDSGRHKTRLDELLSEYLALKGSTDAEYAEYISAARSKIDAAYAEIASGADFKEVMLRYTEDPRITGEDKSINNEALVEKGELISLEHSAAEDWSDNVKAEFGKLTVGRWSEVFAEDGGFMMIYYASDEASGDVPVEAVYDDIRVVCSSAVRDEQWEQLLTEWKKDPALIIDTELIASYVRQGGNK